MAEAARIAAAAFISSRLDYCNSLLYGLPDTLLQSVQNAIARLLTGTRRRDHITPVLRELHWLPIRERLKFKVACLVRQSLSGESPVYLTDDCCLVSDSAQRYLRSADVQTCVVPRTYNSYGDRTFAAAGPRLWSSLPVQLHNPDVTHGLFRRHLIGNHGHCPPWLMKCSALKTFTYLFTYLLNVYKVDCVAYLLGRRTRGIDTRPWHCPVIAETGNCISGYVDLVSLWLSRWNQRMRCPGQLSLASPGVAKSSTSFWLGSR